MRQARLVLVWPVVARQAGRGGPRSVKARLGWQEWRGLVWRGAIEPGVAGMAWYIQEWSGEAMYGAAGVVRLGKVGFGGARHGRHGAAWFGGVSFGALGAAGLVGRGVAGRAWHNLVRWVWPAWQA